MENEQTSGTQIATSGESEKQDQLSVVDSAKISEPEYIESLERMVCFLAHAYQACKKEYRDKHLQLQLEGNPDQRELTESEIEEVCRFPLIQKLEVQRKVGQLAVFHQGGLIHLTEIRDRIREKYRS